MWLPEKLQRDEIERRAERLVIDPLIHIVGMDYLKKRGLQFEELYTRVIKPRYGIKIIEGADLSRMCDGRGAWGSYDPVSNVVLMDGKLCDALGDPRRTFTLFHEVCGHGVLQGHWLRAQSRFPDRRTPLVDDGVSMDIHNRDALEWQANTMAGLCAAPLWLVNYRIVLGLRLNRSLRYIGPRRYWLGGRAFEIVSFEDYCRSIATLIKPYFGGLSAQALGYRVQRSKLVYNRQLPPRRC